MKKLFSLICILSSLSIFAQEKADYPEMNLTPEEQEEAINLVHEIRSTNEYIKRADEEKIHQQRDVFFHNTTNGVRKFNGRVSAVLNSRMLNLKGSVEIIPEEADGEQTVYKTLVDIDGNRIIHGPYLLPVYGTLSFGLYDVDGNALKLEKEGRNRSIKRSISFGPKKLTAYILEDEIDYRNRIQAINDENEDRAKKRHNHHGTLPITGPYLAKIEFDAFGIQNVTFYELLPSGKVKTAGTFNAVIRRMRGI